jgi:hypothetical protein
MPWATNTPWLTSSIDRQNRLGSGGAVGAIVSASTLVSTVGSAASPA